MAALALMIPVVASLNVRCLYRSGSFGPFVGSNVYHCQVLQLNVQSAGQFVDGITGNHVLEKTNSDVKVLWIINQICHYLPKNFENYFPNIEVLAITDSGLKNLTKDDLKVFKHLKSLYMNANTFKTLDADLFQLSPKLQHIDMAKNQIASLPSNIFDSLENLEQVMLDGNVCSSKNYYDRYSIEKMKDDIKTKCQTATSPNSCENDSKLLEEIASLKSLILAQKSDECSDRIANLEASVSVLINDNLSLKKLVSKIPKQVANIMKTLGTRAASTDVAKQEESDEVDVFSVYPTTSASTFK